MAILGGGSTELNTYTDPLLMPINIAPRNDVCIWKDSTLQHSNIAGFWNDFSNGGSVADYSGAGPNTYRTLIDLTGEGYMNNIILPIMNSNLPLIWTLKFTVDGVVYERSTPSMGGWQSNRCVWGFLESEAYVTSYNSGGKRGRWRDDWRITTTYGSTALQQKMPAQDQILLQRTNTVMSRGVPTFRYETALKIEMKWSDRNTETAVHYRYAGVTWIPTAY